MRGGRGAIQANHFVIEIGDGDSGTARIFEVANVDAHSRASFAIGAVVRIFHAGQSQMHTVRGGSSYLSQSEFALTFGLGKSDRVDRITVQWPSGAAQEFKSISAGNAYELNESKGLIEFYKF